MWRYALGIPFEGTPNIWMYRNVDFNLPTLNSIKIGCVSILARFVLQGAENISNNVVHKISDMFDIKLRGWTNERLRFVGLST